MAWIVRLVCVGAEGEEHSADVMRIAKPDHLTDLASRFCQRSRQGGRGMDAVRALGLRGLQNGKCGRGTTEVKEASAVGGDMLAVAGAGTEMGA